MRRFCYRSAECEFKKRLFACKFCLQRILDYAGKNSHEAKPARLQEAKSKENFHLFPLSNKKPFNNRGFIRYKNVYTKIHLN